MTIQKIRKEVKRMDSKLEVDQDEYVAAVVCLSALHVGTSSIRKLAEFTGYAVPRISPMVHSLRSNGVFRRDGKVACAWFEKDGQIAFWMDVCIALGWMQRA
jgi:hypothetical protein